MMGEECCINTISNKEPWITEQIRNYVNNSPDNNMGITNEKAWGQPIIGFASGADELFKKIKEDIGDFYWQPIDIFKLTYPDADVTAEELTVISWIHPQTEQTKLMQRAESNYPSHRWVLSRIYGEDFNKKVAEFTVNLLKGAGHGAVAPMVSPLWENKRSEKYGYASTWSERHTAYISGLGTFGLCDGLITPVGKAMRCGSVIAKILIEPSKRPYSSWNEYCLYYSKGTCKACVKRCPAQAISEKGHDKIKCRQYQREAVKDYTVRNFKLESTCCGLCQTGVPCESGIPGVTNKVWQEV